ncbi:MAG: DUF2298 domain-containing protein, partial [Anaerolineales bacterium]
MIARDTNRPSRNTRPWIYSLLLILVLIAGGYLRLVGLDWDQDQHLHPDERFLTMVESGIQSVNNLSEYFDTANSSLNPHNRGFGFYVYGTFPIFIVRYVAEWLGQTGYSEVYLLGRGASAIIDLLSVLLVYQVGKLLYDRRVGVLGAAFLAFSVLPIQQSHFFTVDTFINFFTFLAIYFAVRIVTLRSRREVEADNEVQRTEVGDAQYITKFTRHPAFLPSLLFGLALGMAVASKINAVPVAIVLPAAMGLYWYRLPHERRDREGVLILAYLIMAALVSVLAFRIFQPYAFTGPGFFGLKLNSQWVSNLQELRAQSTGDVDFPPALQWARRPVWFSLKNMVLWGLGLPLGLLAWAGFLWMGWRILRGEWRQHALLWGWTALYFGWQSFVWNSTMRYQMPIYPSLAIFGAWAVIALYDRGLSLRSDKHRSTISIPTTKVVAVFIGSFVLLTTFAWAFAFTRIYTRPHTRLEASRWLFQNAPGPINLQIKTHQGTYNQPLPFSQGFTIRTGDPYQTSFVAKVEGNLSGIYLPHVVDQSNFGNLILSVTTSPGGEDPLGMAMVPSDQIPYIQLDESEYYLDLDQPVALLSDQTYYLNFGVQGGLEEVDVCGPLHLLIQTSTDIVDQELSEPSNCLIQAEIPLSIAFTPNSEGTLSSLSLGQIMVVKAVQSQPQTISVTLSAQPEGGPLATAAISSDFSVGTDHLDNDYHMILEPEITLVEGETYYLRFELEEGQGAVAFVGAAIANESTWDDGLPLRMHGYDPYGGIYLGGLNFEMYWADNQEKLYRFVTTLNQADFVLITSSRQWASTSRLPERYPLTSEYYRRLLGCPADKTIEWCYNVAQPEMFEGSLGFDLVKVFQSNPSLGPWQINDQSSEEAFTVYDHPKVLIFQKSQDYEPRLVKDTLGVVDLSRVIHITPKQADSHPGDLMLPTERLVEQREGGTWSNLFNVDAPQNRFHILGVALWYVSISIVGLLVYPLIRFALPGLSDRGYPLSRTAGLLFVSYLVWLAGSFRIPFSRLTIGFVLFLLALTGGLLAYHQRASLRKEWRERRYYFLLIEVLFLVLFIVGLLIRLGNPDLWHPWKGGEKPMDFSYFNAVLKSTTFPPYDPWFAGGYINYYYYGFVFVGVLVKFLGLIPSVAYNMILPTLFAMIAMCAFSLGWNLTQRRKSSDKDGSFTFQSSSIISAIAAALGMAVLGNLGTLRMVIRGFQSISAPLEEIESAGFLRQILWSIQGFVQNLTGTPLPIRLDEWYWNPSRVIAAEHGSPITEFPFFTFLYADLHAHLIALPLTLFALACMLSIVLNRKERNSKGITFWQVGAGLFIGALAVGSLFPTNTWDFYPYIALGVVAVGYAFWRSDVWRRRKDGRLNSVLEGISGRILFALGGVILFVAFSIFQFQPYRHWYGQAYNQVEIWTGTRTPISDYITHWGVFLFVLITW